MNQRTITSELLKLGIPPHKFEFGWLGDAGPGIHLIGTDFYSLLPIGDEDDLLFAHKIAKVCEESLT